MTTTPQTLIDKIWSRHVVQDLGRGWVLLHIDRHILHDLSGPPALLSLRLRGIPVAMPELVFATPDHAVSSAPGRTGQTFAPGAKLWAGLKKLTSEAGIRLFDLGEDGQGIVHVMGPELGLVLPGTTVICGDSHTCTNGGIGALAFGVGTSESSHALATGVLRQRKPKTMRIMIDGPLGRGVTAKDMTLHIIAHLGAAAGVEHSVEYAGSTVRALPVEARLTLCNLSVELGAKSGIVAPDERTFAYVTGRRYAPSGALLDLAITDWRTLASDERATFDKEAVFDARAIAPTVTWGTSPQHSIAIDEVVPDPTSIADPDARKAAADALTYMGLEPLRPLAGTRIDRAFIGSCTNSRISDLREAAAIATGRRVAEHVTAWVVPGSVAVKRQAEAEGLDRVFTAAGFEWREPGCSMCVSANGELVAPGERCISTSNRNFVGRQGPGARTHLASPAMAAAAAITGSITDVRSL
jgi:3-isopropylmalate/(R)-2-methylmalate dehydratase large subunit